jgi:hypothetical protein
MRGSASVAFIEAMLTIEPYSRQQGPKRHAGPEATGQVDVEHLHEGLDLELLVAGENAGAVDQCVDAPVLPGE